MSNMKTQQRKIGAAYLYELKIICLIGHGYGIIIALLLLNFMNEFLKDNCNKQKVLNFGQLNTDIPAFVVFSYCLIKKNFCSERSFAFRIRCTIALDV